METTAQPRCQLTGLVRCARDLLAPLALDAVDEDERPRAEAAIRWCETCALEHRFLSTVAADLAGAAPTWAWPEETELPTPPVELWWRIALDA